MHARILFRTARRLPLLLLPFLASPLVLRAQFQPVNPDELKMTSDPKAPGAAAVYLDCQEIDNDPMHFREYYARIKVLTEKGKDLATVEMPYLSGPFRVTDIQARTIHSDGTIIPLSGSPDDLLITKSSNDDLAIHRKVFNLPSVEAGSILEYRFRVYYAEHIYTTPNWDIQRKYFVHKAHYQFTPFKNFMPPPFDGDDGLLGSFLTDQHGGVINNLVWWQYLPEGVKIQTSGTKGAGFYKVDVTDVPPLPDEEWMPPIQDLSYRVQFYYKTSTNTANFWKDESGYWSKDVDHFAEPVKGIRDAVAAIVASSDDDFSKAQKLYAAVQALDNTDFSRHKSATELKELKLKPAARAEDVWNQKSGSSNDLALLYLAMLRAAGLQAYAAKVVDRSERNFDPGYMDFGQLTEMLVILDTGGKEIYLDPGEKMCPFGLLHWHHSGAKGIRQSAQGIELTTTAAQNYHDNTEVRTGVLDLDQHGGVTGNFNIVINGQAALRWRQAALRSDESAVRKQFDEELGSTVPQGVEARVDHFLGLDQYNSSLVVSVRVNGLLGTATADRLILPAFLFSSRTQAPFVKEEKREVPVDMQYGGSVVDDVTYHLPAGYAVEGAPQDARIPWAGHAIYITQVKSNSGQIDLIRSFARAFTEAAPAEYPDLRDFYQKVATADQQDVVVRAALPVAKVN